MMQRRYDHIALVGMMGSGKSAVGKALAERLGWAFEDIDAAIVHEQGCDIATIFANQGEPAFRDMETRALRQAVEGARKVIATGGGAFVRPQNREILFARCRVVWLLVDAEEAVRRVQQGERRPKLEEAADPVEAARRILEAREPLYALADWWEDTRNRSVEDIAIHVAARWQSEAPGM